MAKKRSCPNCKRQQERKLQFYDSWPDASKAKKTGAVGPEGVEFECQSCGWRWWEASKQDG